MQEKKSHQKLGFISFSNSEDGFALPSILFLVTILSLVVLSILTVKYLHHQSALLHIAKVKADYAAVTGINKAICEMNARTTLLSFGEEINREYSDEMESVKVILKRWGLLYWIRSQAKIGKISASRTALLASRPASQFNNALYFANDKHQLELVGTTKIIGDVVCGKMGVTIGTIAEWQTPRTIPVEGLIKKEAEPKINLNQWQKLIVDMNNMLMRNTYPSASSAETITYSGMNLVKVNFNDITEKIKLIIINGNASLEGKVARSIEPLVIIVKGNARIENNAQITGAVLISAKEKVEVYNNAQIDNSIIFSQTSIEVKNNRTIKAQLLAPSIFIRGDALCSYPSILVSFQLADSIKKKQEIQLENGSVVEGTVAMLSSKEDGEQKLINLQPSAKVRGAIISEKEVTLDGSVDGTVLVKDFYFHSVSTTYLGWIRSGRIDRRALPASFLIPPCFSQSEKMETLDWL